MSDLSSENFNEHTDCVMVGHAYCDQGCCDGDMCLTCGHDRGEEE